MLISEQIENILENHKLTNNKAIRNMLNCDLSSYENYNGSELVQADIDNYAIELAAIKGEAMYLVIDHNNVVQATSLTNDQACMYANKHCLMGEAWAVIPHGTGITI